MKTKHIVFAIALVVALSTKWPTEVLSQQTHHDESFVLEQPLSSEISHEYIATDFISLEKGFFSNPNVNNSTYLHIEPYEVYPPIEGITTDDGCVVGTMGGTVNIGALGAACYTIPISVPIGINGIQPNLSVSYNSQMGNGLLGWGWNLEGVSCVQRANKTHYHDGDVDAINFLDDQYIIDGLRLIRIDEATKENSYEYRTEMDGLSKIVAYTKRIELGGLLLPNHYRETATHFIVWTADGKKIEYGNSEDSKIYLQETDDVCLWLVNRVEDREGNYMEYHYEKNFYGYKLTSITYTGNDNVSPVLTPFCEMKFNYDNRLDKEIMTIGPDLIKHPDLLKSIVISKKNVAEQTYTELYHYEFEYYDVDRTNGYPYTRLNKVNFYCGEQHYRPVFISWPDYNNPIELTRKAISTPNHENAFNQAVKFSGDFNGDGYSDVIITRPTGENEYVEAEVYLNKGGSNALQFDFVRTFDMGENADWIYVGDFNGDGRDDILFVNKKRRNWPYRDQVFITVHLSAIDTDGSLAFWNLPTLGPYKIKRKFRESMESVLIGDFFAKGRDGIIIQSSNQNTDPDDDFQFDQAHYIECAPDCQSLIEQQLEDYMPSCRLFPADFDGDGATEILYLTEDGCFLNKMTQVGDNFHYNVYQFDQTINDLYDCYTGDFNGDGKADLFSCHKDSNDNPIWQVNLSKGNAFTQPFIAENFNCPYLGSSYIFSLQDPHSALVFVKVADFNGDGYCDVRYPQLDNNRNQNYYFGPIVESGSYAPFSREKQLHTYVAPGDNMSSCLGLFVGKESCDDLGSDWVFKIMPNSERYNIDKIFDELNNTTEFEYGYLLPSRGIPTDSDFYQLDKDAADLSKHVLTVGLPLKAVKKVTTINVSGRPVSVNYQYKGLMYHQWGKGVLGFTGTRTNNSISIHDARPQHDETLGSTEKNYNLTDYEPYICLAPSSARTYDKDGFMLSETTYENAAYKNVLSRNQKAFFPVTTKTINDEYDIDNECFLRKSILETQYYNDGGTGQYNKVVRPTAIIQGVTSNQIADMASICEYQSYEEILYHPNEYGIWLINRPYQITTRNKKGNETSVGKCVKYTFYADEGRHHQLQFVDHIPNNPYTGPDNSDPLTTKTEYTYDNFGRIKTETLSAPNDNTLPVLTNTIEYGPEYDYRLKTRTINAEGDETNYTYDNNYDFCSSVTDFNGQVTQFIQDPLGITKSTIYPDGTESCQAIRWEGVSYNCADYSIWRKTTGGAPTKEYIERTGKTFKMESKNFNGRDIVSRTIFDQYGRVWNEELPHLIDETPGVMVYDYDDHHRLSCTTYPDATRQEIVYNGLETTVKNTATDDTELSTKTLSNIVGWTSIVIDASNGFVTYDYYPDGKLRQARVNNSENVQNEIRYDHLGNRIWHKDPDYGITTSLYNAYGQLKRQENPRGFVNSFDYDILGRLVSKEIRDDNDQIVETTVWNYSEETGKKGTLSSINYNNGQQTISYNYDNLLRVSSVFEHFNGDNQDYITNYTYDPASRIETTTYPTGITTTRHYNIYGYMTKIEEGNNGVVWQTDEVTEKGLIKRFTLGNGLITEYDYYPETNLLKSIQTKRDDSFIQNLFYEYDDFHNLAARTDNKRNLTEGFTYDAMNRLTGITLNEAPVGLSFYDAFGRMTSKTKDERLIFTTDQSCFDMTNKPHALRSALAIQGVFPETIQSIEYTPFDKVRHISDGGNTLTYDYGFDHQRIRMVETVNGASRQKIYLDNCEIVNTDGNTTTLTYLGGPIGVFAVIETKGDNNAIHYIHKDHLGSWTTITGCNGQIEQELSFDAWGDLRNPNTWTGDASTLPMFGRGFTGHEHLPAFGLINMNGRCYDPMLSSFLSVDAFVDDPASVQGFNRYAYCGYNPLRYTDPSGWQKQGGRSSYNPFHENWSKVYAPPVYEPRDFTNAYYLYNMALYGSFSGCDGGGGCSYGDYSMGDLYNTYGYQVTHYANSVYNYCFPSTQFSLIRNWQFNPSKTTSVDLEEAGIRYLSIGVSNLGDGTQSSCYTWNNGNGKIYYAEAPNEYIGSNKIDSYCLSFQPQQTNGPTFTNNSFNHFDESACGIVTLIGGAAKQTAYAYKVPGQPIPKSPFTTISKVSTAIGIFGLASDITYNIHQARTGVISQEEAGIRVFVSAVEFGVTFIPYVGPFLSVALTAYDISGGFDNNLYSLGRRKTHP